VTRRLLALAALAVALVALPPLGYALFPERAPEPELPPAGRAVALSPDVAVNVLEAGSGPAVVLVHGHPGSAYDWAPTTEDLVRRGRRVVAYDRVGYGRSGGRPGAPSRVGVETNAEELVRLLAALDLRDVTLVGWSYGGGMSILAAKRDASRIARLVLVGSVGPGVEHRDAPPKFVAEILAGPVLSWVMRVPPARRLVQALLLENAFAPAPAPPAALRLLAANFARPHTLAAARSEGCDLGGEVDLDPAPVERPILVLHGVDDRLVPFAVAQTLAARARQGELRPIPHAGHMLPATHATLLADAIVGFAGPAGPRHRSETGGTA
jgi:pimeloyl-ACP methyl ester carboxylesterase